MTNNRGIETEQEQWDIDIKPQRGLFDLHLDEVWKYRDLVRLFVRRDFVAFYKQTILGPVWFFVQPLLTTLTFVIIFGRIAGISTDGLPQILFYLAGITMWNYFAECLKTTSDTFTANAHIFGKVYFPRIAVPLSVVLTGLLKLGIQFVLFLGFFFYYYFSGASIAPNSLIFLTPFLVLLLALISLGFGMIFSSLTTKYRDMKFLLQFGIQLFMYATPIIYPLSSVSGKFKTLLLANPLSAIIETFKYAFLGTGAFDWTYLGYSTFFAIFICTIGIIIFNKVEQSFMDTV